jgi:dUTP pyrophosphatase
MEQIIFTRLSADAVLPTRAAGGCDLYSAEEIILQSGTWTSVRTDILVHLPPSHYGRIVPRSGPPLHPEICIRSGVIEETYREELSIHFFNHLDRNLLLAKGIKIAQLILEKNYISKFCNSRWHRLSLIFINKYILRYCISLKRNFLLSPKHAKT